MPYATPEGSNENPVRIAWVGNHAVTPLEVEARDPMPGFTAIGGAPSGRLETASIENPRVPRVNCDVVDVLILGKDISPLMTAIDR
jgi:hypothetical protein